MRIALLFVLCASSFVSGCGGPSREAVPLQPAFVRVRMASAQIQLEANARAAHVVAHGATASWQDRLSSDVKWLDQLADELERLGAYGPPRDEQADELQRIAHEMQQAAECDPALVQALMPSLRELQRTAKKLRELTLPPDNADAPRPLASR